MRVEVVRYVNVYDFWQGRILIRQYISRRSITCESARLPLHHRRFAHSMSVLAWTAFWLNAALIPCCEAFAATPDDHAGVIVQATTTAEHTKATHDAPVETTHHAPDWPCGPTLHDGPATNGEQVGLQSARVALKWDATYLLFTNNLFAKHQTANLARVVYNPRPRKPRLYLRTQRLLI